MGLIRVLLADDHDIVRFGISSVLHTAKDIEVVAEASSGPQTVERFRQVQPDVSIIDISMPETSGIKNTHKLIEEDSRAKILILTMHMNETYLNQVLKAGALGYLLKNSAKNELLEGVRKVNRGETVFSESISRMMTEKYISEARYDQEQQDEEINITTREAEILRLIADGLTSQEIANKLYISVRTVDTHRANLMQKLKVKNTAALVRFAIENGYVSTN